MRSYFEQRAKLARLEAARAETERCIAIIERQIAARAQRMTTSSRVKARQFGHASTSGTRAALSTYAKIARHACMIVT